MPKQSFRDLLNFKYITPIVDQSVETTSDSDKLIEATRDERVKNNDNKLVRVAPNDLSNKRLAHIGTSMTSVKSAHLSQREIDAMDNWWGLKDTEWGKMVETNILPVIKAAKNTDEIISEVLSNGKNSYRFLKEIVDDPFGNKWYEAVKNDREETLIAAVKKQIDAYRNNAASLAANYRTGRNLYQGVSDIFKDKTSTTKDKFNALKKLRSQNVGNNPLNDTDKGQWDPYTYKDYMNTDISAKDYADIKSLESITMPMDTSDVKDLGKRTKEAIINTAIDFTRSRGTLVFAVDKIKKAIFSSTDESLGWHIREFAIESKLNSVLNKLDKLKNVSDEDKTKKHLNYVKDTFGYSKDLGASYYREISSPYNSTKEISSPIDALNYAKSMGFCSGYKDLAGFSLDSSHLWGMTIEPYEFPGYYKSLAPPLPKYIVPTWTLSPSGNDYTCNDSIIDFGTLPPVTSYSLNIGTSMEKDITLYNGSSIKIPVGFSYNYSLTVTFADDQHASMKNYMMYYYNTIFRPEEGLMAPYELCSFLITITSFKPGLKVKNQLKLICVPVGYSVSQGGDFNPSNETVQVGFSVVGMKTSSNYRSVIDRTIGGIWSNLIWNDVIMRPVNNDPHTAPKDDWISGYFQNNPLLKSYDGEIVRDDGVKQIDMSFVEQQDMQRARESMTPSYADKYNEIGENKRLQKLAEKKKFDKANKIARRKMQKASN